MSQVLQDQRIQHLLPSILSQDIKLPNSLHNVIYGTDKHESGTPRGGGCNDAFSVFAFLAFLLALLQLMQDMGAGRSGDAGHGHGRKTRAVNECLPGPDYEGDLRLREGTLAAYAMFTGKIIMCIMISN